MPNGISSGEDEEVFTELEGLMHDFLHELQGDVGKHPLIRYLVVAPTEASRLAVNVDHFQFSGEKYPAIDNYIEVLLNHALVEEKQPCLYKMTEPFVKQLRRIPESRHR
jgi:hypothetical protein